MASASEQAATAGEGLAARAGSGNPSPIFGSGRRGLLARRSPPLPSRSGAPLGGAGGREGTARPTFKTASAALGCCPAALPCRSQPRVASRVAVTLQGQRRGVIGLPHGHGRAGRLGSEFTSPRADPGKGSGNFLRAARFKKSRQARPNFLTLGQRLVHSRSCGTTGRRPFKAPSGAESAPPP